MTDEPLIAPLHSLRKAETRRSRRFVIKPRHVQLWNELQKPEHRGQIKSAMSAVGYSPAMQSVPQRVTETKSWQKLLEEHLPESLLARRHEELLNKREGVFVAVGKGKNRTERFLDRGPDTTAVSRGLELAYKLRGSFVAEPTLPPSQVVYNLFYKPEVRAQLSAFETNLKHAIAHEIAEHSSAPVAEPSADRDGGAALPGPAPASGE